MNGDIITFAWDWAIGMPELLSDSEALYLVGHDTLGLFADDAWAYYLPDALGSVRQATDVQGAVTAAGEWFDVDVGAPSVRRSRKRLRWFRTVCSQQSSNSAVAAMVLPESANKMIRIRVSSRAGV